MNGKGETGLRLTLSWVDWTPLRAAVHRGHARIVAELVSWHNRLSLCRLAAIEHAMSMPSRYNLVPLLLDGIDKSVLRQHGRRLAMRSAMGGCVEM
eukprot:43830-Eustigmatos_ZCMA.PRE.1